MFKKLLLTMVVLVCGVLLLSSCKCKHEWQDATCTAPKTCLDCGETEGEALGHTGGVATCTEDAICSVCSAKYGEKLGHSTEEAWVKKAETHCKKYFCCGTVSLAEAKHTLKGGICTVCGFDPTISASEAIISEDGKTATISVSVADNPGMLGLEIEVTFDTASLVLLEAKNGTATQDFNFTLPTNGVAEGGKFLWDSVDVDEKAVPNGEVLQLTFDISGATEGEYQILLKVSAFDSDMNPVSFKIVNGTIKIEE